MRTPLPTARTLGNHLSGSAAADFKPGADLCSLARECGIDTTRWHPVGLEIFGVGFGAVFFYVIDTHASGGQACDLLHHAKHEHANMTVHKLEARNLPPNWHERLARFHLVFKCQSTKGVELTLAPSSHDAA